MKLRMCDDGRVTRCVGCVVCCAAVLTVEAADDIDGWEWMRERTGRVDR